MNNTIFSIDNSDISDIVDIENNMPQFIFLFKVTDISKNEQAIAFGNTLIKAFTIDTATVCLHTCKILPNNLTNYLSKGGKILSFGFPINIQNLLSTYDFESLQNLPKSQKLQVWGVLKSFIS